jgi:DNA-binding response OmpR family regulator
MTKILVIDDDTAVRETLSLILQADGYDVVSAEDGDRGMAVYHRERPDLVITDIIMPEQEGIQTISEIRAAQPNAKIIAISGSGRVGSIDFLRMAELLGATDSMTKPFCPDDLLSRVKACLAA